MIVLHMGFSEQIFFLWGERSFTRNGLHNLRRMRRVSPDCVIDHIWDPGAAGLEGALSEIGFSLRGEPRLCRREVWLPTFAGKYPVPSSPLLGEIPRTHIKRPMEYGMCAWLVDALDVDIPDVLGFVSLLSGVEEMSQDGMLLAHGVMAGLDLCYLAECARFAMSLLERGRFLPDVRRTISSDYDAKYEPVWRPVLMGEDATRFARLTRVMPDILRSYGPGRAPQPALAVLDSMFGRMIDGAVRHSWAKKFRDSSVDSSNRKLACALVGRKSAGGDSQVVGKRAMGRLVNALNPHSLWARALGWLEETDGLSQSLESIFPDVRKWWDRFEWMAKAPFKVCLEVVEPEGEAQSPWRLEYMIHSLHTGVTVRARDAWMLQGRAGDVRGDYMRRYLLIMLGLIGAFVKPVTSSLEEEAPTGCDMSLEEASDFLGVQAEDLTGMGVGVRFPQWWEKGARDALTLRGRVLGGMSGNAAAPAGDGEALALKWELALGGAVLSDGERSAVMDGRLPLMRIRGGWRFIDPNHLQAVRRHIESLPSEAGAAELVRLAVRDQYIDGFMDAPELERIYDSLRECRAHEPLSAPGSMNGSLRPYQSRGYSWLSFLSRLGLGACLADDMGLGKTVQALAMIQHRRDCGDRRPVLLVCPMSVMENWRQETGRFFPGMSTYVHHGRARDRGDDFVRGISGCAMVLTSYALLQREISLYQRVDWQGVVLDEAQNIKNPDTQQARAARAIKSEWRVVLTGTPIENHVGDLWSIMEFLMPGMLGSRRSFVNCYVKPIQEGRDAALMEDLRKMVAPFVLRRMKTDRDIAPDLPMKIETKVYCGLKREQVKLYSGVAEALTREIGGAQGIRRRGLVLAALTRAKQICDHPSLVMKDLDFGADRSAKLERLFSLAEEMHETGDKALIFTQYVEMGDILKHQLQERFGREVMFLHGSVFKDARDRMVRRFQEEPGPRFFVLSMKAGGVGLNLTGANHVVMYDRWWNPAVENQAIDRAYRIGQTRNVHVHIFCCRGTLEERIDELIASKKEVAGMVIESNDNWITELSDYELQRLLLLRPAAMEV